MKVKGCGLEFPASCNFQVRVDREYGKTIKFCSKNDHYTSGNGISVYCKNDCPYLKTYELTEAQK